MNGPILKGKKVILKPMELCDAPNFVKWFKDKEVTKFLSSNFKNFTLDKEIKFLKDTQKDQKRIFWFIYTEDKKVIGNTEIRLDKENRIANFGIVIGDKDYWNQGLGQDTLKTVMKYCFNTLKLNRFELLVFSKNIGGLKCYTNCGLRLEGTKRQCIYRNGKYFDEIIMSLLKGEYKKIKNK
ncbi:MAG: GNAT family protein [Patescibacteria group bacterium]|jgi:RimJ/RimL family protein N-acetyltransferase